MIKYIKQGNLIYQNIEPFYLDENGNKVWNIPDDPERLKSCLEDTLGWLVAQKITKTLISADKEKAATTKGIVLLAKIISTLNPDTSSLTENERQAYNLLLQLANVGYSDSDLLQISTNSLLENLQWYKQKLQELERLNTLDELIQFAENLE